MAFVHARTFETRWGLALAFIDLDDANDDVEVLKLQMWVPAGEDGSDARLVIKIGLNAEASDEAHNTMSEANRSALVNMDSEKFEAVMAQSGAADMLDNLFAVRKS